MPKYETIPQVVLSPDDEEAPPATTSPCLEGGGLRSIAGIEIEDGIHDRSSTGVSLRTIIGGVAVMASMLLAILAMTSSSSAGAITTPILGSTNTADATQACTFDECYASNCNQLIAPYTCLRHNGGPHGGCSPAPWITPSTCTTQCDLTHCADLDIPDDTESCDDIPCEEDVCMGERLCEHHAPYQCTAGSARFGCSEGKFEWTLNTADTTCSSCCNAKSCKNVPTETGLAV